MSDTMESLNLEQPTSTFQGLSDRDVSKAQLNGPFADSHMGIKKVDSQFTISYDNISHWIQSGDLRIYSDSHTPSSPYEDTSSQLEPIVRQKEMKMLDPNIMARMHKSITEIHHLIEKQKETFALLRAPMTISKQEMLPNMLANLFYNARDEVFESGMNSRFSEGLHRIILEHGIAAIEQLRDIILSDNASTDVADEALRQLGRVDDAKTYDARLSLLESALKSDDLSIRNAAAIGIDYMEDPRAIPNLERAAKREQPEWFRQYLNDVITQLKKDNEVSEIR